jgi:hypothetical protein
MLNYQRVSKVSLRMQDIDNCVATEIIVDCMNRQEEGNRLLAVLRYPISNKDNESNV